jgi:hypothetical protein
MAASPAGVFVLKDDNVRWRPAVDVNRIALGAQLLCALVLMTVGRILVRRRR